MATLIASGKTKKIFEVPGSSHLVRVVSADDITALDGERREEFPSKGIYSTQTNHYVMELLERAGLPVAYVSRTGPDSFLASRCTMWPYEVVAVRRVSEESSIRKRNPKLTAGHVFEKIQTQLFLKTTDYQFEGIRFEKNDPYIAGSDQNGIFVSRPDVPLDDRVQLTHVPAKLLFKDRKQHDLVQLQDLVKTTFLILERAWHQQGCILYDLKIECGVNAEGRLVIADVIDNDSWRLLSQYGVHLDKQPFRDKTVSLEVVAGRYREVAERAKMFDLIENP